jgi:antitoxin YefM
MDCFGIDIKYGKAYIILMTTVSATTARANLYNLIDEVAASGKRVGITKKGETKAVLISQEELESWEATLDIMSDPELMKGIKEGEEDIKAGRVRDWEDIKKELNLDVSDKNIKSGRKRA